MASEIDFSQMGAAPAQPAAAPAQPATSGSEIDFSQMPVPTSTAADIYKGGTSGVAQISGIPAGLAGMSNWLARQAWKKRYGMTDEQLDQTLAAARAGQMGPEAQKGVANIDALMGGAQAASSKAASVIDPISTAIGGGTSTYQPQTEWGKGAQIVGGFLPAAIAGEATLPALAGRLVTKAVAPATGAYVGGKIAPAAGLDPVTGQIIGGLVGGALRPSVTPELGAAAETLGTQLPAAATGGLIARTAGKAVQKLPFAGGPLNLAVGRATRQATAGVGSALEEAGATTPDVAGQIFKDAYSDWKTGELNPATASTWNKVSAATDQSVTSPLSNTDQLMQQIAADRARAGLPPSPVAADLVDALAMPNGMAFDDMKRLRTAIGAKTSSRVTPDTTDAAEYNRAYDTLTQDMGQAAMNGGGQPAYDLWQQAVNTYKTNLGRQQAVAKIIGLQGDAAPELVVNRIQNMAKLKGGDIGSLQKARATIGNDAWQKISGSIAQQMGTDPATGDLSLSLLQKAYAGLSDAGREALYPTGTPLRQALDAVGPVTRSLTALGKPLSLSGHGGGGAALALLGEHLLENPITALKIGAPTLPVAALLSTPATASSLTRWLVAYRAAGLTGRLLNAPLQPNNLLIATRNLANTANSQLGMNMDPDKVMQALQAQGGQGQSQ